MGTTQPPRTAITKEPQTLQSLFRKMQTQIEGALPRQMQIDRAAEAERLIRIALTEVRRKPDLMKCTHLSIVGAVVQSSQLGLELDGNLGQAYLVPYKNKHNQNRYEAQLQIGWRGYITLARRSGEVSVIYPELVFDCDYLKVTLGDHKELLHEPDYNNEMRGMHDEDNELIGLKGAYAVVRYKDGGVDFEYLPLIELNRLRARSKSLDSGPWITDPGEMYRKSPIRRLAKRMPLSTTESMRAAALDESVEAGVANSTEAELDLGEEFYENTQDSNLAAKATTVANNIKTAAANARATPPPQATVVAPQPKQNNARHVEPPELFDHDPQDDERNF